MSHPVAFVTFEPSILAIPNKNGKVTRTAEKAAQIVSGMSDGAKLAAAINGKGAIGKHAAATIKGARTLGQLLAMPMIDGGQWADVFGLLVQELNVTPAGLVMSHKAKPRCLAYIAQVRDSLVSRFSSAETVKAQDLAQRQLERLTIIEAEIVRLVKASEAAAAAAAAAPAALEAAPAALEAAPAPSKGKGKGASAALEAASAALEAAPAALEAAAAA